MTNVEKGRNRVRPKRTNRSQKQMKKHAIQQTNPTSPAFNGKETIIGKR